MKKLVALLVMLFAATSVFAQTPTATPTAAFDFPNAPTQEQTVSGPLGQTLVWDGKKWVAQGTPAAGAFLPLTGGTLTGPLTAPLITVTGNGSALGTTTISSLSVTGTTNAAAIVASGTITGNALTTTGSVTAANASISGVMNFGSAGALYFNGVPMGGSCTAGNAVTLISNKGVPTCSPFTAGGPWLPVNNPTYTGVMTGPNYVVSGSTDSLTWNDGTSGLLATFGDGYGNTTDSSFLIGQSMSYTGGVPNSWTLGGTVSYGPTAASSLQMFGAATVITGDTGKSAGQTFLPTMLFSISPVAYSQNSFMGNSDIPAGATFRVPMLLTVGPNSSLEFGGTTAAPYGSFTTYGPSNLNMAGGTHTTPQGWIADSTASSIVVTGGGAVDLYAQTGLTVGSAFSPTRIASFNPTALNLITGTLLINGQQQFYNGTFTPMASCTGGKPAQDAWGLGDFTVSGNMVEVAGQMGWSTMTGGSGTALMTNLPFTAMDSSGGGYRLNMVVSNAYPQYMTAAGEQYSKLLATVYNGNNYAQFNETNYGSVGYLTQSPCHNIWTNQPSGAWFNGTYRFR